MNCTCDAIVQSLDPAWVTSEAEPHHPDCPCHVVTAQAIQLSKAGFPPPPALLPLPLSTYRVYAGCVDEITWTSEDDVIRLRRWGGKDNADEVATNQARLWLRTSAKAGVIVGRRHPEYGYWEYGPQWRAKDFQKLYDAATAARMLGVPQDL